MGPLLKGQRERPVLVVEDDPQAARLLTLQLRAAGYQVTLAGCGEEALQLAAQQHPLAITLDLLLPDRDGWEVLTQLKQSAQTQDIPVLIISVIEGQSLGLRLGAAAFLVKPVPREALLRALEQALAPPVKEG